MQLVIEVVEYAREATTWLNGLKDKSKFHCLSGIRNYLLEIKAITTRVRMVDSVSMFLQWIRARVGYLHKRNCYCRILAGR